MEEALAQGKVYLARKDAASIAALEKKLAAVERGRVPRERDAGPYRFVRAQNLQAGDRVMLQGARPLTLRTVLVSGRGDVRAIASNGTSLEFGPQDRVRVSPGSGVLSLRDARPSARKRKQISDKIRLLVREGYPQRQAIAIALRRAGVPPRRRRSR